MLSSEATWVDKLAVWWWSNQRATLLSPDSSEIVDVLLSCGEGSVSVNVILTFSLVVTEVIWDDKNGRYASVFLFFFYDINWSRSGQFVCDHLLTAHLSCLSFVLILTSACSYDAGHWMCWLMLSFITCAFCQHHSSPEVWAHQAYLEGFIKMLMFTYSVWFVWEGEDKGM